MVHSDRGLFNFRTLRALALPALTVAFGMQTIRVFFPSIAWYLKDNLRAGSLQLAGYAFGTFLFVFLAAALRRLTGPRIALWLTAGGLALFRIIEQLISLPSIDLWLSMTGSALFVLFLPIFVGHLRAQENVWARPRFTYGLILGLSLDSAIHSAAATLDLSWIPGLVPTLVIAVLTILVFGLLWTEPIPAAGEWSEVGWLEALPLLPLGVYLALQALIFQNQGWISEVGGLSSSFAFTALITGNLLTILGLSWGFSHAETFKPLPALAVALYLGLMMVLADHPSRFFVPAMLIGQLLMGWSWALLSSTLLAPTRPGLIRTTVMLGFSMILFLVLTSFYYASLDIDILLPRTAILPSGAILMGLILLYTATRMAEGSLPKWRDKTALIAGIVLTAMPLAFWNASRCDPGTINATSPPWPIRVMTYNIHSAYASNGRQDPEAIARVIEESGADIIALQEVSRGWLVNGSTDLATWLSCRLGMQILFKGTTDPMWGNAILTRYPILEHGSGQLPLAGTRLARGYLWARLDIGVPTPLLVIATHLHHVEANNAVRLAQVPVLIDFWDKAPQSLLMGDMNAEPGYPEMDLIAAAGMVDSWAEAGIGDGLTWPAIGPF